MIKLYFFTIMVMLCFSGPGAEQIHTPARITPGGQLEKRIELTEKRLQHHPYDLDLIVQDVARIPGLKRRFEEYEGDVSGRILGAWSYISRLTGQHPAKLDSIAERILPHQNADGSFGMSQIDDGWDMWGRQIFGHGRLLVGLIQYYRLCGDQQVLNAAQRLGDYFKNTVPKWTTLYADHPWTEKGYADWENPQSNRRHFIKTHQTSILEGLVMLYEETGDDSILETGKKVAGLMPEWGHYHSHSYLNTLTGMAMLYAHTKDADLFQQLSERYWQYVMRYGKRIDGSVCEWYPVDHRTEGCSLTDWLRLNLALWSITQDAVYLTEAENTWRNGLYFHQTANGAFGHAVITPAGYESAYSESWWCCLMHGLYAYAELLNYTAASRNQTVRINFLTPASCDLMVNENPVQLSVETDYPAGGNVIIKINPDSSQKFLLKCRIPDWAENPGVKLNGASKKIERSDGYLSIERTWKAGDELAIEFAVPLRVLDEQGNNLLKKRHFDRYAYPAFIFHGPLLLAADTKHNADFPQEIIFDQNRIAKLSAKDDNSFAISGTHYQFPSRIGNIAGHTVLVPMGEQTGYKDWTDQWRLFKRNGEEPIQRVPVQTRHKVIFKQE